MQNKIKTTSFRHTGTVGMMLEKLSRELGISKSETLEYAVRVYYEEIFGDQMVLYADGVSPGPEEETECNTEC